MSEHQIGLFAGFPAVQAILTSCTHGYAETIGDEPAADWLDPPPPGLPASQYPVPSNNPKGTAYVVSLGPYSSAFPAGPPLVIPEGKMGNLDLYFPLGMASRPLYVDLLWLIHRGGQTNTFSTRIELLNGPSEADVYYRPTYEKGLDFAFGPGWWWAPDLYWAKVESPWWGWGGRGAFVGTRFAGYQGSYHGAGFHGGGFQGGGFHGGGSPGGGFHGGGFHGGGGHR